MSRAGNVFLQSVFVFQPEPEIIQFFIPTQLFCQEKTDVTEIRSYINFSWLTRATGVGRSSKIL